MTKVDLEYVEKLKTLGTSVKNPQKIRHNRALDASDMRTLCHDKNSPIGQMVRDRVMYRNIVNGNGSDKILKKEAEIIQRTHQQNKDSKRRAERYADVTAKREKYKKRYKCEPL